MHSSLRRSILPLLFVCLLAIASASGQSVPKFLYVVNYDINGTISGYRIQPLTGQLSPLPGSPFAGIIAMQGLALTPDQKFLYASGVGVAAYSVNPQTGSLTQIATYTQGSGGRDFVTPNGKFLYVVGNGLWEFAINPSDGTLTSVPGSPVNPNSSYAGVFSTPNSGFAYADALLPSNEIDAFSIQPNGELFPIFPVYSDPASPIDIVVEPSGRFVYAVNYGGGVSGYAINQDGSLSVLPGSPYATGGQAPNAIAASSNGRTIIVDNQAQNTTASLAIEPDGSLLLVGTPQPSAFDPGDVIVDPTSEFVYTSGVNGNSVSVDRLDPVSQALQPVPGMEWATGSNPYAMAVFVGPSSPYCLLNETEPSVTLCAPTTTSVSPVRVVAGTTSATPITQIQISVDGVVTYASAGATALDVPVDVSAGSHKITVGAKNQEGQNFSISRTVSISESGNASCTNRGIYPDVAVCSPLAGSTTGTLIHVKARSYWYDVVSSTAVYVDGVQVYSASGSQINTYITVSSGAHRIKLQSTDPTGFVWSSTVGVIATDGL